MMITEQQIKDRIEILEKRLSEHKQEGGRGCIEGGWMCHDCRHLKIRIDELNRLLK